MSHKLFLLAFPLTPKTLWWVVRIFIALQRFGRKACKINARNYSQRGWPSTTTWVINYFSWFIPPPPKDSVVICDNLYSSTKLWKQRSHNQHKKLLSEKETKYDDTCHKLFFLFPPPPQRLCGVVTIFITLQNFGRKSLEISKRNYSQRR